MKQTGRKMLNGNLLWWQASRRCKQSNLLERIPMSDIKTDPAGLLSAGFIATTYAGQAGVFFVRRTKASDMPYLRGQIDGEIIYEDSIVVTEVIPNGRVQVSIPETGYLEEPVDAISEEGQGALRDCLSAPSKPD